MRHIYSIYDTNMACFALNISLFQRCLLLLSPSPKSHYSHSEDSARECAFV